MLTLSAYRSRSALHVDAYASHFVGTVLHGAGKKYLIFSPKTAQRDALQYDEWQGIFRLEDDGQGGSTLLSPTFTVKFVVAFLQIITLSKLRNAFADVSFGQIDVHKGDAWEGDVVPGELIFIPSGCPHTLVNKAGEATLSISQCVSFIMR